MRLKGAQQQGALSVPSSSTVPGSLSRGNELHFFLFLGQQPAICKRKTASQAFALTWDHSKPVVTTVLILRGETNYTLPQHATTVPEQQTDRAIGTVCTVISLPGSFCATR
ncbi:hypothetical protein AAFF_G00093500 [Aldrovandia affinis]|uniref:Uncharacterized protein n=1 Tax=Aldrovandia affinis TaxID=143900 RepID=A0AAD7WYY8_9TELE|nr:hypothetical protein AAFF_G00093500 [Aldrovandia affinis]